MTTATITPAAPAAPAKGKGKTTPTTPAPLTPAQIEAEAAKLRTRYEVADKGEAQAWDAKELADKLWQNARVIKVRVAYAAAMLTPYKGEANLLAATRFLLTDPADTPAKRTAAAKSRKNTLRNYVAAGAELAAKGLAERITEPDEEERKIVAAVFREMNKRDKAEAKQGEGEGEGEESGESTPEADESLALGVSDLVVKIAELNKVLNLIKAGGIRVSETDASHIQDMLMNFANELTIYSEDV